VVVRVRPECAIGGVFGPGVGGSWEKPTLLMSSQILLVPYSDSHWTRHASAADAAVAVGVLVEILLVIVLGVLKRSCVGDFSGDPSVAGRSEPILIRLA